MSALFPVFLKMEGRLVAVVGGGDVAHSKIPALLSCGARVKVIAPKISAVIKQLNVICVERGFQPEDLNDAWYVVAADTKAVNHVVNLAASSRRIFVNAVDDTENASAYLGSVVKRAGVTIACSTSGSAPSISSLLREGLETILPDEQELARWLTVADAARLRWKSEGLSFHERKPALLRTLNALYEHQKSSDTPANKPS